MSGARGAQGMLHGGLNGQALAAWLTRLDLIAGPPGKPSAIDALGRWLGWTDAIPLAAALQSSPTPVLRGGRAGPEAETACGIECDLADVRSALVQAIEDDGETATDVEFPPHRRRCQALQQAMAADIAALRSRARAALARRSPTQARLAAIDAVLGQVLGAREQALLAMMPTLLERHFDRQRQVALGPDWLAVFRRDMKQLLQAELDLRLQPVQGLIEALRTP